MTDCKCENIKRYDDEWKCMICFKPYVPSEWVQKTVAPSFNKSQVIIATGLLHDALNALDKVEDNHD